MALIFYWRCITLISTSIFIPRDKNNHFQFIHTFETDYSGMTSEAVNKLIKRGLSRLM